jgi:hypothetical protein
VADGGPERLAAVAHMAYAIGRELGLSGPTPPRAWWPICSYCKKVRDEQNTWHHVESYLAAQVGVTCSHGICPTCWDEEVVPQLREAGLAAGGGIRGDGAVTGSQPGVTTPSASTNSLSSEAPAAPNP